MYIISNQQRDLVLRLVEIVTAIPTKSLRLKNTQRIAKLMAVDLRKKKSVEQKVVRNYEK